jgi:hypothetical protein
MFIRSRYRKQLSRDPHHFGTTDLLRVKSRIRILIKVKSGFRIQIPIKVQIVMEAQNGVMQVGAWTLKMETWRLKMEPWRFCGITSRRFASLQ